ncbi:MAG TPA: DNA-binding domain-containing protein [Terriglobia bacterium]|nr:DNA-binding domain-containing protein [Terriglobia bacterium]
MTQPHFANVQQWMQSVITNRGTLEQKLSAAAAAHGLTEHDVVASKRGLSVNQRLEIYAGGYVLRLLECLRADFPGLRRSLGPTVFDMFAKAYLLTQPPASYTLFELGGDFPKFLRETRPVASNVAPGPLLDLPIELARLERAQLETMRAPGLEDKPGVSQFAVSFDFLHDGAVLKSPPCRRLLKLKFPLLAFMKEIQERKLPEPPSSQVSFVVISRILYSVQMTEIESWQYAFLEACAESSSPAAAARESAGKTGRPLSEVLAELVVWLPVAFEKGWLCL